VNLSKTTKVSAKIMFLSTFENSPVVLKKIWLKLCLQMIAVKLLKREKR
jgi:hypothetical protein